MRAISLIFACVLVFIATILLEGCSISTNRTRAIAECKELPGIRDRLYCITIYDNCENNLSSKECLAYIRQVKGEMAGTL